ncbi:FAD-dependent thymidylate synthase, partial [Candidatus Acetothermia bacterium]|nr:FAD-dependent thymidylate synthase [Candidatus Acetothermia bacterium]
DHGTPFEHAVFKFHVKCPIIVTRQWFRHRISCITGDTQLWFDFPGLWTGERKHRVYKMTVGEFYRKWHEGAHPIPHWRDREVQIHIPVRRRLQQMQLRCVNEQTQEIETTQVTDVVQSGEKDVFQITLADGKMIKTSREHRFYTTEGWQTLEQMIGLELKSSGLASMSKEAVVYTNGEPIWQSASWLRNQRARGASVTELAQSAECSYHTIRKWLKKHDLQFNPEETRFAGKHIPWNKGKTYQLQPRTFSAEHLTAIRKARSGPSSNFWKGGVTPRKDMVFLNRWRSRIYARDDYTCRLCQRRGGKLHAHHVVPVWADPSLACDLNNIVTLCVDCHRQVNGCELEYAEQLTGAPIPQVIRAAKPPRASHRFVAKPVKVVKVEYLGKEITYDLVVSGPHHNYIANGFVVHNSYNEISGRYTEYADEFYVPEKLRTQAKTNKQASQFTEITNEKMLIGLIEQAYTDVYAIYKQLLEAGIARELARTILPQGLYTQFYWTVNARALMHFISLRADSAAQWEIRQYAEKLALIFKEKMPWTWDAFVNLAWKGNNPVIKPTA